MIKLLFVLLGSFWLSCGNTPETVKNQTVSSEADMDAIKIISPDSLLTNDFIITDTEAPLEVKDSVVTFAEKEEPAQTVEILQEKPESKQKEVSLPNHSEWNILLATYVNENGDVDYKNFLTEFSSLEEYLNYLAENSPKKDWSKNEKLAYYINIYNAATVKLILDNYPTKSIKDIKNPWGRAWVRIGESKLSLGAIEHKILRKMNEPRIHFAINCASFSCPKLLNEAFTADQIESQLEKVTVDFVNDLTRNIISEEKIQLSNIFKWYKKDFTENGSLVDYIRPYTQIEISENTNIDYIKYNWSLNEIK